MQWHETVNIDLRGFPSFLLDCLKLGLLVYSIIQLIIFIYILYERYIRLKGYIKVTGRVTSQKSCRGKNGVGRRDYIDYQVEGKTITALDNEITEPKQFRDEEYNPIIYEKKLLYNPENPFEVYVNNYLKVAVKYLIRGVISMLFIILLIILI